MSEESQEAGQAAQNEEDQQKFLLHRIYIKDLSFESPRPVEAFSKGIEKPEVNLQLNTQTEKKRDNVYEVTLEFNVTAKIKDTDETIYIVELQQSGLFIMENFSEEELTVMMSSYCPSIIFPYARENISNVIERGGFPQLLVAPVNFEALYRQHLEKVNQQATDSTSDAKH